VKTLLSYNGIRKLFSFIWVIPEVFRTEDMAIGVYSSHICFDW